MSWHFSQAMEAASLAANFLDGAPSAPSKSNQVPAAHSAPGRTTDALIPSQSGTTCEPLTESRGVESWISSLAASRARTSALQEGGQESPERGPVFGPICGESLARFDPATSWLRTHQLSLLAEGCELLETLPPWGMIVGGELYQQPTPSGLLELRASITSVSGSGLPERVPTPTASDATGGPGHSANKQGGMNLRTHIARVPTPTVCGNYNRKGASKTSGDGLATVVRRLPTPNASDANKWSNQSMAERIAKGSQVRLNTAVSPEGGRGGQLNPTWVEWLMGWPLGWTDCTASATDKFRMWLCSRGRL